MNQALKYRLICINQTPFGFFISWLFIILPFLSSAQYYEDKFQRIPIEIDGEEVIAITAMAQDQEGYIWMSTNLGLLKYDGYQPKVYKNIPGDSTSLPNDGIESLYVDNTGAIWVGRGSGLSRYMSDCDCFSHYDFKSFNLVPPWEGYGPEVVIAITEDMEHNLWIGLHGGGLFKYNRKENNFTRYLDNPADSINIVKDLVRFLLVDAENNIWIGMGYGARGEGLVRFNPKTEEAKRFLHDPANQNSLLDNRISALAEDQDGRIMVGTYKCGLHIYDPDNEEFNRIEYNANQPNQMYAPCTEEKIWGGDPFVRVLHQDQGNGYWVGTTGKGLNYFNPSTKKLSFYSLQHKATNMWSFLEDRQGNIWIGSLGGGLYKMDPFERKITFSQKFKQVSHIYESQLNPGTAWIASRRNGLFKMDLETNDVINFLPNKKDGKSISHNSILTVHQENKQVLWIGFGTGSDIGLQGGDGGLDRMDLESGTFKHFRIERKDTLEDFSYTVFEIVEDEDEQLWLAAGYGGLFKSNKEKTVFNRYPLRNVDSTLVEEIVFAVHMDSNGTMWVSDSSGEGTLFRYNRQKDQFVPMLTGFSVMNMVEDKNGMIWMSTWEKGLLYFNPTTKTYKQYTTEDGLPSNEEISIIEGDGGNYWIGSSKGPSKMDAKTGKITSIGLPKSGYTYGAFKSSGGKLFFYEFRGLISFYPDEINGNPFPPDVNVSDFLISGVPYQLNTEKPEAITLSNDQNNITFQYVGFHFSNPLKNQYQYKLTPFDDEWINAGTERTARYTNLDPGTYTFHVKAANSDGVWNEEGTSLQYTINPPWWQSTWAYLLFALTIVTTILGSVLRFRTVLKKKQKQLEKEQAFSNQLTALNEANSRFVPKDFLQLLEKESILNLKLGDQVEAKMTILFADIRSYTTLSEKMTPKENFQFINNFLGRMGPVIHENGGFICQYFGDGIMALFKDNHHFAIKAAIEMQQNIQSMNTERLWKKQQGIWLGIGLNTGHVMLGVIGDQNRYDSSVISDAVNTASRMEGLTKIFGGTVIITEKTLEELKIENDSELAIPSSQLLYRFLGKIKVKGKDEVLKIYDLFEGETEEVRRQKAECLVNFEKAIQLYFNRKFGLAADLLKVMNKKYPDDMAISYYFERAVKYAINGVEEEWSGVEEMVSK